MNIGFISTRLAGTDGVSLETYKLAVVLQRLGHNVFYCAGELDTTGPTAAFPGMLIPELHFTDKTAVALGQQAFNSHDASNQQEDKTLIADIGAWAGVLRRKLDEFITQFSIDAVIAQNIFAIPMQLPLAQALTELLAETNLPTLAHNHDFYWERERFRHNKIDSFLDTYFPPDLPNVVHGVINSQAQQDLKARRGIDSILIPNVFDFATPAPGIDTYNADFREAIGLAQDDWLILQPTRVIARKGIELAIELVARLDDPRAKLVIPHHAGDEGLSYLHHIQGLARERGVDLRYVADRVDDHRGTDHNGRKIYSLWDTYPHANLVTYPSLYEGFGNALIETVYFRCPALVNHYSVYTADIAPLGFQFAEIAGTVTDDAVAMVRQWLEAPETTVTAVNHNYQLGARHFSYDTLEQILAPVFQS